MPRQKISGRMQSHNRARFALRAFFCHACLPSLPGAAVEEAEEFAPELEEGADSFGYGKDSMLMLQFEQHFVVEILGEDGCTFSIA